MTEAVEDRPPHLSLASLFVRFLKIGLNAFGGPVAQIALIRRELVEEEGWISGARFNRLLAVMQALPGPEAHELCVHLGMTARGRIGGLLAGLGFMLPGLLLMLLTAWLYVRYAPSLDLLAGAFLGIQIAVVAVIVRAVWRIGRHVLEHPLLWIVAAASLGLSLLGVTFWIALIGGGAVFALRRHTAWAVLAAAVVAMAAWIDLYTGGAVAGPIAETALSGTATAGALFWAGLKGGLLTFGGAYTAIPYVRADTVGRGWLNDGQFLDGVAFAGMLPAPLVIFATFAGYLAGGLSGALAITVGMFLPAFAFSMIFYERLEAVVETPALHDLLAGIAAAAVGIIAVTAIQLGWATADRVPSIWVAGGIFALALVVAWVWTFRLATPVIVLASALAGWLAFG